MLIDVIVSVILVLIIGGAIAYIVRSKKRGQVCVGCPYAKQCAQRKGGCSCGSCQDGNEDCATDSANADAE